MIIGSQFTAVDGYKCLEKGHIYHYLYADRVNDRVLVVEYVQKDDKAYTPVLYAFGRSPSSKRASNWRQHRQEPSLCRQWPTAVASTLAAVPDMW